MDVGKLNCYLEEFVTEDRKILFQNILANRTKYVTVVLEDIFQPQNASAVLRTCDCLGIQDVHIIENNNQYNVNPDVTLGSDKWLNMHKYNQHKRNTRTTLESLKNAGYRVVATTPHTNDIGLGEFDLKKGKVALLFGTELNGLSDEALDNADEFMKIPMYGFTESFNISVSASIILYQLTNQLRQSAINWGLAPEEKEQILLQWLSTSIKDSKSIIKRFLSENRR